MAGPHGATPRQNPSSVHPSWDSYFRHEAAGTSPDARFQVPPTLRAPGTAVASGVSAAATTASPSVIRDHLNVLHLVRAYQVRGLNKAKLDPLGLGNASFMTADPPELQLATYGFTEAGEAWPPSVRPPGVLQRSAR